MSVPFETVNAPPQSFSPVRVSVAVPSRMPPYVFVMDSETVIGVPGMKSSGPVAKTLTSASAKNGFALSTREGPYARSKSVPVSLPRVKNHHWEFAEAVRGGARPFSDYDHSVPLTEMVLLGAISQRVPGRLVWNQAKGQFDNSEAANALLRPHVRHGWTIG